MGTLTEGVMSLMEDAMKDEVLKDAMTQAFNMLYPLHVCSIDCYIGRVRYGRNQLCKIVHQTSVSSRNITLHNLSYTLK